ncbi:MAG: RNA methyltransferase [Nitrospirota bacterium]
MRNLPSLPAATGSLIRDLLHHKQVRDAEQAFVLEGVKPVLEALRSRAPAVKALVVTPAFLSKERPTLKRVLERHAVPRYVCRETAFGKLSDVEHAQGILAVVRKPEWDEEAVLARPRVLGLFGERLQDPANVGAIIRTAAAMGLSAVWLTSDSADPFNPKVVRTTTGTLLQLPIFRRNDPSWFLDHGCALLAAEPHDWHARAIREIRALPRRAVLAVGNESRGLSEATLKQAAIRFYIPLHRGVDSLNVAASVAIAVFYFSGLPKSS